MVNSLTAFYVGWSLFPHECLCGNFCYPAQQKLTLASILLSVKVMLWCAIPQHQNSGDFCIKTREISTNDWKCLLSTRWINFTLSVSINGSCIAYNHIILRNGNISWSSRFPDLTACYFLWGYLKSKVYCSWHTMTMTLNAKIWEVIINILVATLHQTIQSVIQSQRLWECLRRDGSHLQDIIFKNKSIFVFFNFPISLRHYVNSSQHEFEYAWKNYWKTNGYFENVKKTRITNSVQSNVWFFMNRTYALIIIYTTYPVLALLLQ